MNCVNQCVRRFTKSLENIIWLLRWHIYRTPIPEYMTNHCLKNSTKSSHRLYQVHNTSTCHGHVLWICKMVIRASRTSLHLHDNPSRWLQSPYIHATTGQHSQLYLLSRYTNYLTLLCTMNMDNQWHTRWKVPLEHHIISTTTLLAHSNHYKYNWPPVNTLIYTYSRDIPTTQDLSVPWTCVISWIQGEKRPRDTI